MEDGGSGGGVVSTAAPAAAAVRLLARGAHRRPRGVLPPERCVEPDDLFPELEREGLRRSTIARRRVRDVKVGVPTEIKPDEYRVVADARRRARADRARPRGAGPAGRRRGQRDPRRGVRRRRARGSLPDADAVFAEAELVLGVKEPQPEEVELLRPEHTLFTYLHLAPDAGADARRCASRAPPASPTRRSRTRTAGCRCSRR